MLQTPRAWDCFRPCEQKHTDAPRRARGLPFPYLRTMTWSHRVSQRCETGKVSLRAGAHSIERCSVYGVLDVDGRVERRNDVGGHAH